LNSEFVRINNKYINVWLYYIGVWNHRNYPKTTFLDKHKHSPFTILSVTILFSVPISNTFPDFHYSVQICHYLYNVTNKQTHSPFTIFSVTILFTAPISNTFPDLRYSVQICHYLPNIINKQTHIFPLHHPLSNSSVLSSDICNFAWLSFLCR